MTTAAAVDPGGATVPRRSRSVSLRATSVLFTVAVLVHNSDHVRRGSGSVHRDVLVTGTLAIALEVGIVVVIAARHRLAPLVAIAGGFGLAVGYVVVHLTPHRSWLSDSFLGGRGAVISWAAALFEIVAALAVGFAGMGELRDAGGLAAIGRPVSGRAPASAGAANSDHLGDGDERDGDGATDRERSGDGARPWRDVARDPVVLAMAAGNALILVLTFVRR